MLTAIVADDEKIARKRLVRLIEETGGAEVVAACAGGREAVEQVIALQPQLLFLDVQMPDLDGFEVLRAIEGKASPTTVFVTAFDQYAGARVRSARRRLSAQALRHDALPRAFNRAKSARNPVRWPRLTKIACAR
jgi:two-component system LytT family response regulator